MPVVGIQCHFIVTAMIFLQILKNTKPITKNLIKDVGIRHYTLLFTFLQNRNADGTNVLNSNKIQTDIKTNI